MTCASLPAPRMPQPAVLYYLHTPYSVIYFALLGHRKLAKELLADTQKPVGGAGAAVSGRPSDMGGDARASQGGPSKGGGGGGGGGGPWTPQRGGAVSSHMQLSARSMKAGGVEGGAVATLPRGGGAIRSPFSPASQQTLILDSSISSAPASSSAFSPPPRGGSGAFFAQRADNGGGDLSLREMALEAGGAPRSGPGPVAEKTGGDDEEAAIGGLSGGVAYVKAQEVPSAKRGSMPRPGSIKEGIAKALGVETGATPAAAAAAEDAQAAAAPNRAAWTAQVYGRCARATYVASILAAAQSLTVRQLSHVQRIFSNLLEPLPPLSCNALPLVGLGSSQLHLIINLVDLQSS